MTVLGGDVAEADATVDGPLLVASEAVLVADVAVDIQILTLITLAVLPLDVVVTDAQSGRWCLARLPSQ